MGLNFDNLPTEYTGGSKFEPAAPGFYRATIEDAKIDTGSNGKYMIVVLVLDSPNKNKIWDRHFYNSEKDFPLYKLRRFLEATGLNLSGHIVEMEDVVKLLKDKQLVVDVKIEEDNKGRDTNVVEPFENKIYYPITEWAALTGGQAVQATPVVADPTPGADDLPFPIAEEDPPAAPAPSDDY